MLKAQALDGWKALPADLPIIQHFEPIPYKAEGSSYGACGVRIDGKAEFIDAVLSRLKDLIDAENCITRLELSRQTVKPRPGRPLHKMVDGAEVCYVRCHARSKQGSAMSAMFDRDLHGATKRFAGAIGA